MVINEVSGPNSKSSALKTSEWTVKDVDSDSIDAFQVLSLSSVTGNCLSCQLSNAYLWAGNFFHMLLIFIIGKSISVVKVTK